MRCLFLSPCLVISFSMTMRFFGPEDLLVDFGDRRLIRAENLLGKDVVEQAIEEAEAIIRHSVQLTLREWDIFRHGTYDERSELRDKLWPELKNGRRKSCRWRDCRRSRRSLDSRRKWRNGGSSTRLRAMQLGKSS